ncbi:roadblock/LC7 domain-containing protein [Nonomuraea antimicrobica]
MLLSLTLSYRFGRSLVGELRRLQGSAVELAEERLPRLVERLRRGDDVDPATEAPGLDPADTAEVDRVVHAFSAVGRTAVAAAVGQAALRKSVGQVFLNLARRNQALLHRQLAMLDTMERRVDEPELLEELFKLDHLTTRMRRHAENLIILSGSSPARRWRDPVPLFDVVRAAVLEVEDYTRVTVVPMPDAPLLVGAAVTDVIHLVAELVENATVFSPPNTSVHVRGVVAANGLALEVEDRGLGLNEATMDAFNALLADVPEFDLADSDRLGLFVVSRLAARHGIKIMLRRSPYDGTTAIVLLPSALLATAEPAAVTAGPANLPRHAALAQSPNRTPSQEPSPDPTRPPGFAQLPDLTRSPGFAQSPDLTRSPGFAQSPDLTRSSGFAPSPDLTPSPGSGPVRASGPGPEPLRERAAPSGPPRDWSVTVPPQEADEDLDGLPMRIPQAHLAPQLRTPERTSGSAPDGAPDGAPAVPRAALRAVLPAAPSCARARAARRRSSPSSCRPCNAAGRKAAGRRGRSKTRGTERTTTPMADPRTELSWLLDDLIQRVPGIRHAIVLSADGLSVGSSRGLTREDAEHLSAISAGSHSLAMGAGRHFALGGVRQTIIEMDEGFLFVTAAGQGARLAVLATADAELGMVTYEMALMVKRVGEHLSAHPRERHRHRPGTARDSDRGGSRAADPAVRADRGQGAPAGEAFDLVAIVTTVGDAAEPADLIPEHRAALSLCRRPTPVADVASHLGLPLNITRVILGDLRRDGLVIIERPRPAAQTFDERLYREVLHGLRSL